MEASNARNRIKTMLAAIVEGVVVLCLMLDIKKDG
jgi:molybdopterin-binding protein